jgi:hypothetical protein
MLVGLDTLNSSRISTLSLASIVFTIIVLFPLPAWVLSRDVACYISTVRAGFACPNFLNPPQKTRHDTSEPSKPYHQGERMVPPSSIPNPSSLSGIGLILIGGWLLVRRYAYLYPWLTGVVNPNQWY